MNFRIHEAQMTPNKVNLKKATLRYITMDLSKSKRILKAAREKRHVTYKRTPVRL